MLDSVASSIHLKLKYHNVRWQLTIVISSLEGKKIIYQALQKDQGEGVAMEIIMASLTIQLNKMEFVPRE